MNLLVILFLSLNLLFRSSSSEIEVHVDEKIFQLTLIKKNNKKSSQVFINLLSKGKEDNGLSLVVKTINTKDEHTKLVQGNKYYSLIKNGKEIASLDIEKRSNDENCVLINWREQKKSFSKSILEDCLDLSFDSFSWYGGPELFKSYYSTNSRNNATSFHMQPFISSDIFSAEKKLGGVLQAAWINSQGWYISIGNDYNQPLWVSFNDDRYSNNFGNESRNFACIRSDWNNYTVQSKTNDLLILSYEICGDSDIRKSWDGRIKKNEINNSSSPKLKAIEEPIWSTWAEYKVNINQTKIIQYVNKIVSEGYPYSVLEIDDKWSNYYGDFVFDPIKFPEPHRMIQYVHSLNFSVMVWITPFCDIDAVSYEEGVVNRYWVMKRVEGKSILTPYLVKWWQNKLNGSAVLDVTNPNAVKWFISRLNNLKKEFGIDGFKLDAGEVVYIPPLTDPLVEYYNIDVFKNRSQPLVYTTLYSSIANDLADLTEVRAAWKNQENNNYVRIMDLDSVWGNENGIGSVIPRVLLFSTLGYRYVLPDMVGGNGYGARGDLLFRGAPTIDLYIRWIQVNLLLPMQLSIPPWRYEKHENYEMLKIIIKDIFKLRKKLLLYLKSAIQKAIDYYIPIAMPMWYLSPEDNNTFNIDDQYCIDSKVIIAPVLYQNVTSRVIYLPDGLWISCNSSRPNNDKIDQDILIIMYNEIFFNVSWSVMNNNKYIKGPIKFMLNHIYLNSSTPCFIKITI